MKFLVDESVEYPLVFHLRSLGFNVLSVAEEFPSLEDKKVLRMAEKEKRIIISNDKDFGELIFRQRRKHKGVILFRLKKEDVSSKIKHLDALGVINLAHSQYLVQHERESRKAQSFQRFAGRTVFQVSFEKQPR